MQCVSGGARLLDKRLDIALPCDGPVVAQDIAVGVFVRRSDALGALLELIDVFVLCFVDLGGGEGIEAQWDAGSAVLFELHQTDDRLVEGFAEGACAVETCFVLVEGIAGLAKFARVRWPRTTGP